MYALGLRVELPAAISRLFTPAVLAKLAQPVQANLRLNNSDNLRFVRQYLAPLLRQLKVIHIARRQHTSPRNTAWNGKAWRGLAKI